jgi:trigger factor
VNAVKIAKADVEYTDEEMQEDINSELENHKVVRAGKKYTIKDGDEVSIDYVGTMDGVEFEGGSAEDYRLEIGSGSFIDDFEEQLIGHHPGEQVEVNVTFPDPYENNPDYAGKDATFNVTIKGIYKLPTFDDAFVAENLSEYAQTVEEYKQYLKDTNYKEKLSSAVGSYITENISADSYPTDYIKHLKSLQMTINEQNFNYMKQLYTSYGMSFDYDSVMAYYDAATEEDYEKILQEGAEENCLNNMAYQDLATQAGITVTDEQYDTFITENEVSEDVEEEYGRPYLIQQYILPDLVKDYIIEHAIVE